MADETPLARATAVGAAISERIRAGGKRHSQEKDQHLPPEKQARFKQVVNVNVPCQKAREAALSRHLAERLLGHWHVAVTQKGRYYEPWERPSGRDALHVVIEGDDEMQTMMAAEEVKKVLEYWEAVEERKA